MQYITESDLKVIEKNTFKVPRFLLGGLYKKISADSKLLFALMMDRQSYTFEDLGNESGYSLELIKYCVKELQKAGLVQINDSIISSIQLRRII
ncbi:hypothetical protein [Acetobacterium bakii]|uniref:Uncharacterized protein n=1 Tax=Acetobacterium bakii TaxID=52689 RepID=A0A0L6U1G3_9FIRM|nr:hypothetical protein [Acetobacterium bakii]KNZ42334.1 hypothetical protein AKG39_06765 [Acetobacterium bakii]